MSVERRGPAVCNGFNDKGGKGEMTKTPISLQDLRRSLYVKAKAEPTWRFWGLYVHVCKRETLHEAYQIAKSNDRSRPSRKAEWKAFGADTGSTGLKHVSAYAGAEEGDSEGRGFRRSATEWCRGLSSSFWSRYFEADFQPGSHGYRPKRTAHQAVNRVAQATVEGKTRIIDIDLRAYFDNIQHFLLLEKVARRVQDNAV